MNEVKQRFLENLQNYFLSNQVGDPFSYMRKKAWDKFIQIGIDDDDFRSLPLSEFYSEQFFLINKANISKNQIEHLILPESKKSHIVFVDGCLNKELSDLSSFPENVVFLDFNEAMNSYGVFMQNRFTRFLKEEENPFALLNAVFNKKGAFLYLPDDTLISSPLQILYVFSGEEDKSFISSSLQLFISKQSKINLYTTYFSLDEKKSCWNNCLIDLIQEEGSICEYTNSSFPNHLDWCFDHFRSILKSNAKMSYQDFSFGSKTHWIDSKVSLIEDNAKATLSGASILKNNNHSHSRIFLEHLAPNCQSNQLFKKILGGESVSSFEGNIFVDQKAQKTNSSQLNHNLLLSDFVKVISKPHLDIFADDVKVSHGATITQLSDNDLFYLQTRGISKKLAKSLLIRGFCREIIELVKIISLRNMIEKKIKNYLIEIEEETNV